MSASSRSPQPRRPYCARPATSAAGGQVGDSGTAAAREFYRERLRSIGSADPATTGPCEVPDLTARWDYQRGNLGADLQLADGDPALDLVAQAYPDAAREKFWLEAARLARRLTMPGAGDETGPENTGDGESAPDWRQDITDPATGLSRLLSERCPTCILRPGDPGAPRPRPDRRIHPAGPRRRILRRLP